MDPFRAQADKWWQETGPFSQLHRMNPVRLGFVRNAFLAARGEVGSLAGCTALDIGCGGGLAAEALARLGCEVTAIDTSPEAIAVARDHCALVGLNIDYRCASSAELVKQGRVFDLVVALELIEHLEQPSALVRDCSKLLSERGMLVISTLNRTLKSYIGAIIAAERLLRWVPRGTHQWNMFITPQELSHMLAQHQLATHRIAGMVLNPLSGEWKLSKRDTGINYIVAAVRR